MRIIYHEQVVESLNELVDVFFNLIVYQVLIGVFGTNNGARNLKHIIHHSSFYISLKKARVSSGFNPLLWFLVVGVGIVMLIFYYICIIKQNKKI